MKTLSREEIVEALKPRYAGGFQVNKGTEVELITVGLLLDIRDLLTKENK